MKQLLAALVRRCGARCRWYRRPVMRRRRLAAIAQQLVALDRRLRAFDALRSRRPPEGWHRPAAGNCRGSAQSRLPGRVLHPAAPSCCRVPRGRRLDDVRDLPAAPSCLGVPRGRQIDDSFDLPAAPSCRSVPCGRRLDDLLGYPAATNPLYVAQSRWADRDAARPAAQNFASVRAGDREGSHRRRSRRAGELLDLGNPVAPTRCGAEIRPCPASPVPGRRTRGPVGTAGPTGRRLETTDRPATPSHSGEEKLDGRPYPTFNRRVRRCRQEVAPTATGWIVLPGRRRHPLVTRQQRRVSHYPA